MIPGFTRIAPHAKRGAGEAPCVASCGHVDGRQGGKLFFTFTLALLDQECRDLVLSAGRANALVADDGRIAIQPCDDGDFSLQMGRKNDASRVVGFARPASVPHFADRRACDLDINMQHGLLLIELPA